MISSLVQENISPWGSEQKTDRTPDRIGFRIGSDFGSDRTGIFAFGAELLFWKKAVLTMKQVDQTFFFRATCVSNNKNRFSFIPVLKFTSSLKIIAEKLFSPALHWEMFCCITTCEYNSKTRINMVMWHLPNRRWRREVPMSLTAQILFLVISTLYCIGLLLHWA